jgi:hypothetical protein
MPNRPSVHANIGAGPNLRDDRRRGCLHRHPCWKIGSRSNAGQSQARDRCHEAALDRSRRGQARRSHAACNSRSNHVAPKESSLPHVAPSRFGRFLAIIRQRGLGLDGSGVGLVGNRRQFSVPVAYWQRPARADQNDLSQLEYRFVLLGIGAGDRGLTRSRICWSA